MGIEHGVTRVTRGENIFNNKIYIGDLASTQDVRCRQRSTVASTKRYPPHSLPPKDVEGSLHDTSGDSASRCVSESRATEIRARGAAGRREMDREYSSTVHSTMRKQPAAVHLL